MLFYTAKKSSKLDPAVIRGGRIDVTNTVRPYDDEPIGIWKEYIKDMKSAKPAKPAMVVRKLEEAKEVLSKRGGNVMKDMESDFKYSVPYMIPNANDSIKKWQDYVNKTAQDVDRGKCNRYLIEALEKLRGNLPNDDKSKVKFNAVVKMTEDIQKKKILQVGVNICVIH